MKLIDVLIESPAGPEIRKILRLGSERVLTELLYVRMRRVAERKSDCDILACIAKFENDVLAQDAVEVIFRCSEVTVLDWHSSFFEEKDIPNLEPAEAEIVIDTEDSFRIVCRRIEVLSARLDKLGVPLGEEPPNLK
jgi:hypothetical protein